MAEQNWGQTAHGPAGGIGDGAGAAPSASLPAACDDPVMLKGAYRLLKNPGIDTAVEPTALLANQVQAVPVVLAVQDTTALVSFDGRYWFWPAFDDAAAVSWRWYNGRHAFLACRAHQRSESCSPPCS